MVTFILKWFVQVETNANNSMTTSVATRTRNKIQDHSDRTLSENRRTYFIHREERRDMVHQRIKICESSNWRSEVFRETVWLGVSYSLILSVQSESTVHRLRKYLPVGIVWTFISIHRSELNFKWIIEGKFNTNYRSRWINWILCVIFAMLNLIYVILRLTKSTKR